MIHLTPTPHRPDWRVADAIEGAVGNPSASDVAVIHCGSCHRQKIRFRRAGTFYSPDPKARERWR